MSARRRDAWDAALEIISALRAEGHVALLAGGCVRDRLLGRTPKDYDVVTDATPDRVRQIFPRSRRVGAKFGVMLVRQMGHDIEVATFRSDGPYSDGRHPDAVTFGSDVEDARRRDFTINGLFFDPVNDRLIDHVGGRSDLKAGIIRTIGDPDRRFTEDHLRMLRAVRFAARLGFEIEEATADAIRRLAPHLESISAERIWTELELILTDPSRSRGWSLLVETALVGHLTSAWQCAGEVAAPVRSRLDVLPPCQIEGPLALAAALYDRGTAEAERVCRALRLSNRLTGAVVWMIGSLPALLDEGSLGLADLKLLMAEELWPQLLELLRAELLAEHIGGATHDRVCKRAAAIAPKDIAPAPLITGDELCSLGISPGPRMGAILKAVYREQLNERITTQDEALAMARRLLAG